MLLIWIFCGAMLLYTVQRSVYAHFWNRKLRLSLRFEARAVTEGEALSLLERSENRKLLPLPVFGYTFTLNRNYASVMETGAKPLTLKRKLALPAFRAAVNRTRIEGLTRGIYTLGNVKLTGSDLFCSESLEAPADCWAQVTVYPAKIPAERLSLPFRQLLGAVLTRRMAQEDPFQMKSIRPYEIYDNPRTINWKASAKTGELKVNQYEYTTDEAIAFLLDMGGGEPEAREELLRLASSLSLLFLRRGVSVALWANSRSCVTGLPIRVPAGADGNHQTVIDESLAQIKLSTSVTEPFPVFLRRLPRELRQALPVVLSADPGGEALRACEAVLGPDGGYYLGIDAPGDGLRQPNGVRVISWDPGEEAAG